MAEVEDAEPLSRSMGGTTYCHRRWIGHCSIAHAVHLLTARDRGSVAVAPTEPPLPVQTVHVSGSGEFAQCVVELTPEEGRLFADG